MAVPSVLATAWRLGDRSAWCVANLLPEQQTIRIDGTSMTLPAWRLMLVEI